MSLFARLRRRRSAFSLVFAYALLLNALIAAFAGSTAVAAALNPLKSIPSLCRAADGVPDHTNGIPARSDGRHQPSCILCGPTCPMGGAMAAAAPTGFMIPAAPVSEALADRMPASAPHKPSSVYRSDAQGQAPPRA